MEHPLLRSEHGGIIGHEGKTGSPIVLKLVSQLDSYSGSLALMRGAREEESGHLLISSEPIPVRIAFDANRPSGVPNGTRPSDFIR